MMDKYGAGTAVPLPPIHIKEIVFPGRYLCQWQQWLPAEVMLDFFNSVINNVRSSNFARNLHLPNFEFLQHLLYINYQHGKKIFCYGTSILRKCSNPCVTAREQSFILTVLVVIFCRGLKLLTCPFMVTVLSTLKIESQYRLEMVQPTTPFTPSSRRTQMLTSQLLKLGTPLESLQPIFPAEPIFYSLVQGISLRAAAQPTILSQGPTTTILLC